MLGFFIKGGLVVALLYAGAMLGFPYYQYVRMEQAVEEAADLALTQAQAIWRAPWGDDRRSGEVITAVTTLMRDRANRVGLQLPARSVNVALEPDLVRVTTSWEAEARFPGYTHHFHFRVEGRRVVIR